MLPRLFEAFEQGGNATTQRFGGLGLGLAICKALTQLHSGTITAASAGAGQGASFTVRLPLASALPAATAAAAPIAGAAAAMALLRILIVEDHGDSAAMLARILSRSGHSVKTATTAAAAIQALGAAPFDLVLSDVGLPDATGYELMREIRERFGVKGIAMTGYGMEEDFAKSREAGFLAHVVKPINLNELLQTIQRVASAPEAIPPPPL